MANCNLDLFVAVLSFPDRMYLVPPSLVPFLRTTSARGMNALMTISLTHICLTELYRHTEDDPRPVTLPTRQVA